ncbi:hypothetical protein [Demequina silvatica]|uniref:hypothetical protein n=1 Tax=Demequina silvatica TaxID=1638988 RepID=UPI0007844D21|nr:hypothetical protein [Demequina silvatica]
MTVPDGWIVIEARRTARLDASRDQVLAAELDLAFQGEAMGVEFADVVESAPGMPHTWTQVARTGPFRQRFSSTLESADPVVTRSVSSDYLRQTVTTVVEDAPGEDGRIGVAWTVRAELTAQDGLSRWIQRASRSRTERSLQRALDRTMTRWAAAVEARAASGRA